MEQTEKVIETTETKMSTKEFWIRFSVWALFSVGLPIAFLAWRYGLFTNEQTAKTSLSGWGVLAVIGLCIFFIYIIKEAKKGMPEGSMAVQCIDGYGALIPLIGVIVILQSIKDSVELFEQALLVVLICEAIAVPINPMPKWAAQNKIDRASNLIKDIMKSAKPFD